MTIEVLHQDKLVIAWLSNFDQSDQKASQDLVDLITQFSEKKYRVATVKSGQSDLLDCTENLLRNNKE